MRQFTYRTEPVAPEFIGLVSPPKRRYEPEPSIKTRDRQDHYRDAGERIDRDIEAGVDRVRPPPLVTPQAAWPRRLQAVVLDVHERVVQVGLQRRLVTLPECLCALDVVNLSDRICHLCGGAIAAASKNLDEPERYLVGRRAG